MTKHKRIALWILLAFLFFVLTPSVILYSQGYRIDWKAKRIVQTGALYFKIVPTKTDILVDGKTSKTTDFFFGSALIGNLFPGSHHIQISKEDYQPWAKQLEIQEKQVTDAKNIILFSQNPEFRIAADHVEQVWQTPQRKTLLLQKNTPEKTWKLVLLNLETTGEETIFTSKNKEQVWNMQWSSDGTHILLQLASGESIRSLVLSLQKGQACSSSPCDLDFLGQSVDTVMFSPTLKDQVIFTKFLHNALVLGEADYAKGEILSSLGNNVVTFTVAGSTLLWLEGDGKLWQKDMDSQNPAQILSSLSYPIKQETEYSIHSAGDMVLLREDIQLLQAQQQENTFKEVFSGAKTIAASPDGKKLALSNDSEIWILYLKDSQDQPLHKAGDKIFLTRLSKNIENLLWLNPHYLAFSSEKDVRAMEIDDRDVINTADLAQFPDPITYWQELQNILIVLSQGKVYTSEKLIK